MTEEEWKSHLTKKPHINLCQECRYLAFYDSYDIKNSNLAGSEYDNGKSWMECGNFHDIGMLPAELLDDKHISHWGRPRCADFEKEEKEEESGD